jgi:hypothetical protein
LSENLSVNSLKGDLSNAPTFNPPLFSLVNTFKGGIRQSFQQHEYTLISAQFRRRGMYEKTHAYDPTPPPPPEYASRAGFLGQVMGENQFLELSRNQVWK